MIAAPPSPSTDSSRANVPWYEHTWAVVAGLSVFTTLLSFWCLGSWALFDPDEGRYAEIPREMLQSGNWITPRLDYFLYFEKPPLFYWSVLAAYHVFGVSIVAARVVPALCGVVTVLATYALGRRMFGARAGAYGALVLATSALWSFLAHAIIIDGELALLLFGALALWWLGHTEPAAARRRWIWLAFWVVLSLAVLAKGPVAVVLVGGCLLLYAGLTRNWGAFRDMQWLLGVPLFFVICAPWYIAVGSQNPSFNHFFWYVQHVQRFLGQGDSVEHVMPFYYFLVAMPLVLFPWSALAVPALLSHWRQLWPARTQKQRAAVFLLCAAFFITLFFSASSGKIITYVLPVVPCVAVLTGAWLDHLERGTARLPRPVTAWLWALAVLVGVLGVGLLLVAPHQFLKHDLRVTPWLAVSAVALLAWSVALLLGQRWGVRGVVAAVAGGYSVWFLCFLPNLDVVPSVRPLYETIKPGIGPNTTLINYLCPFSPSFPFYSGHRFEIVDYAAEENFGIKHASAADLRLWSPTGISAVEAQLRRASPTYVVVKSHAEAQGILAQLHGTAVEIAWNGRRSVLGNQAAVALTPPSGNLHPATS